MTIQIVGNGEVGIMADISIKELIEEMVQSDPTRLSSVADAVNIEKWYLREKS